MLPLVATGVVCALTRGRSSVGDGTHTRLLVMEPRWNATHRSTSLVCPEKQMQPLNEAVYCCLADDRSIELSTHGRLSPMVEPVRTRRAPGEPRIASSQMSTGAGWAAALICDCCLASG